MILYFINNSNDPAPLVTLLPALIGLAGVIVGALITFFLEIFIKNREIKFISLNTANYIALLLILERASLQQIKDLLNNKKTIGKYQKVCLQALFTNIKQDSLEKILNYQKFYKFNYATVIQTITLAEQSYRNCFELAVSYNEWIQKFLETPQTNPNLQDGYRTEIDSSFINIEKTYNDAVILSENAKKSFDELCLKVFGDFYTPLITGGIVKATEIDKNLIDVNEKKSYAH